MSGPHGPTDPKNPDEQWAHRGAQPDQGPSTATDDPRGRADQPVDATQTFGAAPPEQPGPRPTNQAWSQPYGYPAGPQPWAPQQQPPQQQPPQQQPPQWGPPYGAPQPYPPYQQGGYQGPSAPWSPQIQPGQPSQPSQPGRSKVPWLIGIGVAALLVVAAVVIGSLLSSDTLDQRAAEAGVVKVLTESYGAQNVANVNCPSGQKVQKGNSFTCTVDVDGAGKVVTLTFTDDTGTYEVSRPS